MTSGRDPEWREACIKALCKCRHAPGPRLSWNFRRMIENAVAFHKEAPHALWDVNQSCRISLLTTAYRDQLPREYAANEPIADPYNPGHFHGQSPAARFHPRFANGGDDYVTWRGQYLPWDWKTNV